MSVRETREGQAIRLSRRCSRNLATIASLLIAGLTVTAPTASADEIRGRQWHLDSLRISKAHEITQGAGVTVGVVDTGVQADHPDVEGNVQPGLNVDTGGDARSDEDGHGTAMASLIAGHGHGSDDGALGIAPEAKILPIGVGGTTANPSQIAEGIRWAVDNGATVINMSIAAVGADTELRDAIAYAQLNDVVLVASAGNSFAGDYVVRAPASYPGVIAVSAVNRSGRFAPDVSVQGDEVGLSAPGKGITHATNKSGYSVGQGTSDSAAIVSGVAALVRARYPEMDAANVINRLVKTADDKGPPGDDPQYGFGVVNPVKALTADVPPVDSNPLGALAEPSPTSSPESSPSAAAPGGGNVRDGDQGMNAPLLIGAIGLGVAAIAVVVVSAVMVLRGRRRPARTAAGPAGPPSPAGGPYIPPGGPQPPPPPGYPNNPYSQGPP